MKKKEKKAPEGAPAWMNTYGDMVTLVLTFFVLLFSMSTVDAQKFQALAAALSGGMSILNNGAYLSDVQIGTNQDTAEQTEAPDTEVADVTEQEIPQLDITSIMKFQELAQKLQEFVEQNNISSIVDMDITNDIIRFTFKDNALFDSGKADIRSEIMPVLDEMISVLMSFEADIDKVSVEGHTDNLPISTPQFPSNWELSAIRASNVVKHFVTFGIDPAKLAVAGYGEYHPIADNDTPEGRSQNRRVELVISRMPSVNEQAQ